MTARRTHISIFGKDYPIPPKGLYAGVPPDDRILCARCEAIAVANGLPSADELAGRHVHKGGVVAVATCCDKVKP